MIYFLGEIYITHRKTIFGWFEYTKIFSTTLVIADDWFEAKAKTEKWANGKMEGLNKKYRYTSFTTIPIK